MKRTVTIFEGYLSAVSPTPYNLDFHVADIESDENLTIFLLKNSEHHVKITIEVKD